MDDDAPSFLRVAELEQQADFLEPGFTPLPVLSMWIGFCVVCYLSLSFWRPQNRVELHGSGRNLRMRRARVGCGRGIDWLD